MIHSSRLKKQRIVLALLGLFILLTVGLGLNLGDVDLSPDRLFQTLMGSGSPKEQFVVFNLRLPRLLIALLAGMALALSGSILQGLTRNDLADPGLIGINSGAGVGVTLLYLFQPNLSGSFALMLPLAGFLGALVTALLIYGLSYKPSEGLHPQRLIVVGVGLSMALSGLMILLMSTAERTKLEFITKWLSGSLWGADWPFVLILTLWLILLIPLSLYKANQLNALGLSEAVAVGIGVHVEKERLVLLLMAVALAAGAVSVAGGIGFIGLMGPHLARALVGARQQLMLPVSVLLGGWLLLLSDTIGLHAVSPGGMPAGIVAALIGAPYFMYLLSKK